MPKYAVDPDGVEHIARSIRIATQFGPDGRFASVYTCGSAAVERAVDETGREFNRLWNDAYDGIDSRAAGAVEAALSYRESENRVYRGARRQRD